MFPPEKASENDLPAFTLASIVPRGEMVFQTNRDIVKPFNRQKFTAGILSHHVGEVGGTPSRWGRCSSIVR